MYLIILATVGPINVTSVSDVIQSTVILQTQCLPHDTHSVTATFFLLKQTISECKINLLCRVVFAWC